MKTKNILIIFALSIFSLYGCEDMHDNYEQYIKDGETIYANKIDSISTFAGEGRIMIQGYITNAYNVSDIVVTWDKGNKEKVFPYTKKYQTDTLNLIVPDLEEGSYEFSIYSKNKDGDKSISETAFATAYGETYKSYLTPRNIAGFDFNDDPNFLEIEFSLGNEYQRNTEVKYFNDENIEKIEVIDVDETFLELSDIDLNKPIQYRTFYVPTLAREKISYGDTILIESTIDLFDSNWFGMELPNERPITKDSWKIVDFSSEEPAEANWGPPIQGQAIAAIDGDLNTFWHTQWSGGTPGYPHFLTIDLQLTYTIYSVELYRRQGSNKGQTKFKIYTSTDGVNFEDQGEFNFNPEIDDGQLFYLDNQPQARYIKYEATEGPNHYAFLAEIKLNGFSE